MSTAIAGVTTPLSVPEFVEAQRKARRPTFEALKKHLSTWPTEKDVIALCVAHLSEDEQGELLKLAVKAPKRKRGRRS